MKNNLFWKPDQSDVIGASLAENIKNGSMRIVEFKNGEPFFELTEQGKKEAEAMMKKAGITKKKAKKMSSAEFLNRIVNAAE